MLRDIESTPSLEKVTGPQIAHRPHNFKRPRLSITRMLKVPNYYTQALDGEFKEFAFSEERAPLNRGVWRENIFACSPETPMDLEIGTGNGVHFQSRVRDFPDRNIIGVEVKYKPLIQTIRGALRTGATNGRVIRYNALDLSEVFLPEEINNVFMHFPDPWTSPRKPKNRMIQDESLQSIHDLQRPGSFFELKTDSLEFFKWSLEIAQRSKYSISRVSFDVHSEPLPPHYVVTTFEKIFLRLGQPIYLLLLQKKKTE